MSGHIKRHVKSGGAELSRTAEGCFVIKVADEDGLFWMFLEVAGHRRLSDLDEFLRKEWLECCGHLSSFYIGKLEYCSNRYADGAIPMGRRLDKTIGEATKFQYAYDFGCTTPLRLTVVAAGAPAVSGTRRKVAVLARHDNVTFNCSMCGDKAVHVCGDCGLWNGGAHCYKCARKHKCGMESMLPAAQSPRVGMCAYAGKKPDGRARFWTYDGDN
jgi:predicted RNA-binding Zn-ribbon protein involved in translation (DUF1610 family)